MPARFRTSLRERQEIVKQRWQRYPRTVKAWVDDDARKARHQQCAKFETAEAAARQTPRRSTGTHLLVHGTSGPSTHPEERLNHPDTFIAGDIYLYHASWDGNAKADAGGRSLQLVVHAR